MKEITNDKLGIILRFDPDEEAVSGIIGYCEEHQIKAGWLNMLGACKLVKLSYYNLTAKEYEDKVFEEDLEVLSVTGNIATLNHKTIIHAHGSFSNQSFAVVGGHIKELIVSATLEVSILPMQREILRKPDAYTGLNLLS